MNSNFAYMHYVADIAETDQTKDGKMVQLNYPHLEGTTDLVDVNVYKRLKEYFPDRIEGGVIAQENLMNVVNYLYDQLKREIEILPEISDKTQERLSILKSNFEKDGILKPDHNTESSINDLANKYFYLQELVRLDQTTALKKTGRGL